MTGGPTGIQDALTIHPDLSVTITHKDSSCTTSISAQDATILQREIESTKGPITTLPTVKPSSDSVQTSIAYDGNPVSLFGNQVTDVINRLQSLLYGGCSTR